MGKVQAAMVTLFKPFWDILILPGNLGIMLLHPGKLQDYQVLGGDCDQERDGLNMKCTDLEEKGLRA